MFMYGRIDPCTIMCRDNTFETKQISPFMTAAQFKPRNKFVNTKYIHQIRMAFNQTFYSQYSIHVV